MDGYRARWEIAIFFHFFKNGCRIDASEDARATENPASKPAGSDCSASLTAPISLQFACDLVTVCIVYKRMRLAGKSYQLAIRRAACREGANGPFCHEPIKLQTRFRTQRRGFVDRFPGEFGFVTAEMTIGGGLPVDRAQ